jgi:hypothetical protein
MLLSWCFERHIHAEVETSVGSGSKSASLEAAFVWNTI